MKVCTIWVQNCLILRDGNSAQAETVARAGVEEDVTAYAGIPLFVQAMRSLDVPGSVKHHLHLKQRQRGLDEASYIEIFLC